jgi:hypothetical protein
MESVSLYSEARNEYLKQMASWLSSPIVEFFRAEYEKISRKDPAKAMSSFQVWCADVPKWNQDVIDTNVSIVLDSCRCDYVEELMTAVFIAHTKMLTAIRVSSKQKKMKITLPKLDHFLHRVFIECARGFWKAPFLFLESVPMIEKQKNVLQMESMCIDALSGAVRSLLPVKSILNEYLAEDEDETEDETEDVKEEVKEEIKPRKKKASLPILSTISTISSFDVVPSTITTVMPSTIMDLVPSTITTAAPSTISTTVIAVPAIPPSLLIKEDHSAVLPPERDGITAMKIDTEPSVHFTPYDTVYDETKESISEIRYSPKISVEDKPESHWGEDEPLQRIEISDIGSSLSMEDMEDLDPPANQPIVPAVVPSVDPSEEEIPLHASGEFEELG